MTCWRCGRVAHSDWCSMPGGCGHCGWSPCRWWCLGADDSRGVGFQPGNRWRFRPGQVYRDGIPRVMEPA